MGHVFHDCDRTFGPGLRQTETNECKAHSGSGGDHVQLRSSPSTHLVLFLGLFLFIPLSSVCPFFPSPLALHSTVFLPTVIHLLICRCLTVSTCVLTISFYISIIRDFIAISRKFQILRSVYTRMIF